MPSATEARVRRRTRAGGGGSRQAGPRWAGGRGLGPAGIAVRLLLIAGWAVLLALQLQRHYGGRVVEARFAAVLERARHERFYGVHFQGRRIGYVRHALAPRDGEPGYRLEQEAVLVLNVLGGHQRVAMRLRARLAPGMELQDFDFSFSSPFYVMRATGEVGEDGLVRYRLESGKQVTRGRVRLSRPPVLETSRRPYLVDPLPARGETLRLVTFDPLTLAGVPVAIRYQGREKVVVGGRVERLHRFVQTVAGVRVSVWLDDQGEVVKEESPAGFVFLREPKFRALALDTPQEEVLAASAAPLRGRLPADIASRRRMRYRLRLPPGAEVFARGGRQRVVGETVVVEREELPGDTAEACTGAPPATLAATPYVQAGAEEIRQLARRLTAGASGGMDQVRRLAAWVHDNLEKRPVLGLPDALATLQGRRGDCNEHAALFAALARAVGIPARIVAGVVFLDSAFYYHAWNEVCLGGKWLSVDTTRNEIPADLTHIRLADGEGAQLLAIAGLVGRLVVEVVDDGSAAPR